MALVSAFKRMWDGNPTKSDSVAMVLSKAFPLHLAQDVDIVLQVLPHTAHEPSDDGFEAVVDNEPVTIPNRIYCNEPLPNDWNSLTYSQRMILCCIYTRHRDAAVRKYYAAQLTDCPEPWVQPFVQNLHSGS